MSVSSNVTHPDDLSERREMKANRHAIRGPHGRFIKPDEYDRYVHDEERRIASLVAPRSESTASDNRPAASRRHFIPTMEKVRSPDEHWAAAQDRVIAALSRASVTIFAMAVLIAAIVILWHLR